METGRTRKSLIIVGLAESQFSLNINGWGCHMAAGRTRSHPDPLLL